MRDFFKKSPRQNEKKAPKERKLGQVASRLKARTLRGEKKQKR